MASLKLLGLFLLYALFVVHVRAEAEADAEADPEADPAGCCSRPTTFVKGKVQDEGIKMTLQYSHVNCFISSLQPNQQELRPL